MEKNENKQTSFLTTDIINTNKHVITHTSVNCNEKAYLWKKMLKDYNKVVPWSK